MLKTLKVHYNTHSNHEHTSNFLPFGFLIPLPSHISHLKDSFQCLFLTQIQWLGVFPMFEGD